MIAVDVSNEIVDSAGRMKNIRIVLSNGTSIPVKPKSIDIIYSNQLMEHLHPDDAVEQLSNIYNALKKNGIYVCVTPNKLNGPHDVSMYFDEEAKGLHLKEYTNGELEDLFTRVGFRRIQPYSCLRNHFFPVPIFLVLLIERFLQALPYAFLIKITQTVLFRELLGLRVTALK